MLTIFRAPFFLPWLYPALHWRIQTLSKEIFLTFDDGPVPGPTEFVLDELDRVGAKATFFSIGDNVRKHQALAAEIMRRGHATGNHTFNHLKGWGASADVYIDNVWQCSRQIKVVNGVSPVLFRPPYGRITRAQIAKLDQFRIIMWDVLTHDYAQSLTPEHCLAGSVRSTRPGSIVVFHDSLKAERNLTYVLPRYLDHFTSQGFTFRSLDGVV